MIIRVSAKEVMSRELLIEPNQKIEIEVGDMVEVVRCKDCFYSYKVDGAKPEYDCRHVTRIGCIRWLDGDDYCSYGKRKCE